MPDMHELLTAYIRARITVTDEELAAILSYFRPITAKKDELLIRYGTVHQRTFFVLKGCLRICFINDAGQEATRYFAFENQFATALVSFITGDPSQEFIQAIEDCELLWIGQKDFYALLDIVPAWEKFYRSYLEKAYVNNTNRLRSMTTLDAADRYRQLLAQNPQVVQRLPNRIVASYLNISQETLSRLKSKI